MALHAETSKAEQTPIFAAGRLERGGLSPDDADSDDSASESGPSSVANDNSAELAKWVSLGALVVQNSSTFVVTRYSRMGYAQGDGHIYISSVVVLLVEVVKMAICLSVVVWDTGDLMSAARQLQRQGWEDRSQTVLLAIPAFCYALQNNLIFVAISNLSAAATQVMPQPCLM